MKAVLIWKDCWLFKKKQDGFWVQCPSSELEGKILPHILGEHKTSFLEGKEHFLSTEWATANPGLLVEPDSYYFIISRDGNEVQPTPPFFPYSSQWYVNPFETIDIIIIDSINDLEACPRYQKSDGNESDIIVSSTDKGKHSKMNEYEIATEIVLPYIREKLNWPEKLISTYGRVPVQIGGGTVWADFVCYISKGQKAVPWLLFEVKQSVVSLEQAFPQAESYSLIIGAPFFCVTDGVEFKFYMTGTSQGNSIGLRSLPPIPSSDYLATGVDYISFPPQIDNLIDLFIVGLQEESKFLEDTKWHDESVRNLHEKVFDKIDSISSQELKENLEKNIMIKPPNKNQIFKQIDENFDKFKEMLKFIRDFSGDAISNINKLLDKSGSLYVRGGGIFFITQLLSGAHPNQYIVLEENVARALRSLGVTDILVKNDTANGYVYINEICKKLFNDKMEHRLKKYGFGLVAVHNFLWHYYVNYLNSKKWSP